MADNLFALLQQARQVATTGDARMFGVEVAIVTNVKDPEKLGRVKVCLPRLPGKPESDWVRVAQPAAGPGRGFYWLPQVNDEVVIAFERGEAHRPFVIGSVWNGKDAPMKGAYADENSTHMIQTKSGHQIILDDAKDAEKIVIADKSGKRTLTFDVKNKKFLIEGAEGDVEIKAAKKIVFQCEDLEIKTSKTGKIDVGTALDVKISQKAQIKAGPRLDLKAGRVDLNPSSLNVGSLAAAAMAAARAVAAAAAAPAAPPPAAAGAGGAAGPAAGGGGNLASDVVGPGRKPTAQARGAGGGAGGGSGGAAPSGGTSPGGGGAQPGAGRTPSATGANAPNAAPAGAAAAVSADAIDLQLVNGSGTPQKGMQVELTLPGGEKRTGKTDDQGHFKLAALSVKGRAKLDVPDVLVAPAVPASVPDRIRFVEGGVEVEIGKATIVELPPRVRRCRLSGLNFETNKTFLLPAAMTGIRQLVKLFNSFEGLVALVNGHTDAQLRPGFTPEFNRGLSVERSDSIRSFLKDDAAGWQKFYAARPNSAAWGLREDQFMLATLKDEGGAPFYQGTIDGLPGSLTTAAYKGFQRSRLISESGGPNAETRLELARAYMKIDGTSLPAEAKVETHGCGQTHPLPETEGDPERNQPKNRRVEVFLFEGAIDPEPPQPCPPGGCSQHADWVKQQILDVDLDQPPGALSVVVSDTLAAPVAGAQVHLSGPLVLDAVTDETGRTAFEEIVPGKYKVVGTKDGFTAADAAADVVPGATSDSASVPLTIAPLADGVFRMQCLSGDGRVALAGRKFRIRNLDDAGIEFSGVLDELGSLFHERVPPGKYRLAVDGCGEETAIAVSPASDDSSQVCMLENGRLGFHVLTPDGDPLAEATVEVEGVGEQVTDADGFASFNAVDQRDFNFTVAKSGHLPAQPRDRNRASLRGQLLPSADAAGPGPDSFKGSVNVGVTRKDVVATLKAKDAPPEVKLLRIEAVQPATQGVRLRKAGQAVPPTVFPPSTSPDSEMSRNPPVVLVRGSPSVFLRAITDPPGAGVQWEVTQNQTQEKVPTIRPTVTAGDLATELKINRAGSFSVKANIGPRVLVWNIVVVGVDLDPSTPAPVARSSGLTDLHQFAKTPEGAKTLLLGTNEGLSLAIAGAASGTFEFGKHAWSSEVKATLIGGGAAGDFGCDKVVVQLLQNLDDDRTSGEYETKLAVTDREQPDSSFPLLDTSPGSPPNYDGPLVGAAANPITKVAIPQSPFIHSTGMFKLVRDDPRARTLLFGDSPACGYETQLPNGEKLKRIRSDKRYRLALVSFSKDVLNTIVVHADAHWAIDFTGDVSVSLGKGEWTAQGAKVETVQPWRPFPFLGPAPSKPPEGEQTEPDPKGVEAASAVLETRPLRAAVVTNAKKTLIEKAPKTPIEKAPR